MTGSRVRPDLEAPLTKDAGEEPRMKGIRVRPDLEAPLTKDAGRSRA